MPPTASRTSQERSERYLRILLLFAVVLCAYALRRLGAFYDLPYIYHPDEPININVIQRMYVQGTLNPHVFTYPSLFYYVNELAAASYFNLRALFTGNAWLPQAPVALAVGTVKATDAGAVMVFRETTILAGVLAVWVCYLIGSTAYDRRIGLGAAALLAISPIAVADARHVTPDTFLLLFVTLTLYAALRVAKSGTWKAYAAAGAAVGAAAATKYNGAVVASCVVVAHFAHAGFGWKDWSRLLFAAATSAAAFFVFSPFVFLDFAAFKADMTFQFNHYAGGHAGMEGNTPLWYLRELWVSAGIALPLAAGQIVRTLRERRREDVVIAGFLAPYLLFISAFVVRNERTLLPALPAILLLAAAFVAYLATVLPARLPTIPPLLRRLLLGALALAMVAAPLRAVVQQVAQLRTPDSRATARDWIARNLPADSVVAIESYAPFVDPSRFRLIKPERAIDHEPDWYFEHHVDYVVLSQGMFGRYFDKPEQFRAEVGAYFRLMRSMELVKRFDDGNFIVYIYRTTTHDSAPSG